LLFQKKETSTISNQQKQYTNSTEVCG